MNGKLLNCGGTLPICGSTSQCADCCGAERARSLHRFRLGLHSELHLSLGVYVWMGWTGGLSSFAYLQGVFALMAVLVLYLQGLESKRCDVASFASRFGRFHCVVRAALHNRGCGPRRQLTRKLI